MGTSLQLSLPHLPIILLAIVLLHLSANENANVHVNAEEDAVMRHQSAFFHPPHPSLLTTPTKTTLATTQERAQTPLKLPLEDPHSIFTSPLWLTSASPSVSTYQHPCHPRQVHLSLGDRPQQQQSDQDKTSMTVSFSIPFRLDKYCHPERMQLYVEYGIANTSTSTYTNIHTHKNSWKKYISVNNGDGGSKVKMRQYNATSPLTQEYYMSDFIYHVPLENLDPATYWYSIHVEMVAESESEAEASAEDAKAATSTTTTTKWEKKELTALQRQLYLRGQGGKITVPSLASISSIATKRNTFTTTTTPSSPTQFAIVGDLGQTYNSTITMLNIFSEMHSSSISGTGTGSKPSEMMMLCAGDMSYANSIQPQWDNWFELMEPIIANIPLMVAVGNHEIECDALTKIPFTAYESRFHMPNRLGEAIIQPVHKGEYDEKWGCAMPSVFEGHYDYGNAFYSFERGLVKVIVLSSYSDTSHTSAQYSWLERELRLGNINRQDTTPWIMVMMHNPFYNTFNAHNNETETLDMKASMESLFRTHGVNLVLSGHDHAYMRSKPVYRGQVDDSGKSPIYMIVGEGGNREGHIKEYLHPTPEPWVARRDKSVYGYGLLNVMNATTAHWKWNMNGRDDAFQDDTWLENQFL